MISALYDRNVAGGEEAVDWWCAVELFRLKLSKYENEVFEAPATLGRSRIGAGASGQRSGRGFRIARAQAATQWGERPNRLIKERERMGILPAKFCLSA